MNKPFLVIGAHGGIGWRLVELLADDGLSVIATARNKDTIANLAGYKTVSTESCDVLDEKQIESLIERIDTDIAGLAFCVGSITLKPIRSAKSSDFLESFHLNALAAAMICQKAEKHLKAAKGSVVLFSTIAVQQGFANHSVVSMAKGAVEGLTRSLAAEWAPNVRVNAIAPSLTDTAIAKPLTASKDMANAIAQMHPIPRIGTPEDSAALAKFLLSDHASWITGQILSVDGGRSRLRVKG